MAVTNLLTISLVTPPLAVALGWLVAGETLTPWALLGASLVLLGVALIVWKNTPPKIPLAVEAKEAL